MKLRFKNLCLALLACTCGTGNLEAQGHSNNVNSFMEEKLNLTQEWDKVFPQSDKVDHTKVRKIESNARVGQGGPAK